MKRLLLLLLFTTGISNAVNINIPDANFKAKLIQQGVDADSDGEISITEAYFRQELNISYSNISDLTGLSYFASLIFLRCEGNQITVLDLTGKIKLETLYCAGNQIQSLNLTQSPLLSLLDCSGNQISNLNLTGLTGLVYFFYGGNLLPNFDFTVFPLLKQIECDHNQITNLNLAGLANLQSLYCNNNLLTSLNISGLTSLRYINCSFNQLTNIFSSSPSMLAAMEINNNQFSSLDLSNFPNVGKLTCNNNLFTSLNLTILPNLRILDCTYNLLTSLNFSNCNLVTDINCSNNQLTTLVVANLNKLDYLRCSDNLLTSLFIKNGSTEFAALEFQNNPNLQFICADENQVTAVENKVNTYGYINCLTNTYCSFTPGGNYNTISGKAQYDINNNGCDLSDPIFQNQRINIYDGLVYGATFTNNIGNFKFYVQQPNITLTPIFENPTYFTATPAVANINFPTNNNSIQTQDFCISPNGIHYDLEIVLVPVVARPGSDSKYQLVFRNKGNQTISGNINLVFDDARTDFISASPNVSNQSLNLLIWNFTNLKPFETGVINLVFKINSPIQIPAVNAGDILNFTATINPIAGDDLPLDNVFDLNQIVVNSYDPNQITCLEGDSLNTTEIGEYLHYNVQFENTGNADAINVVLKDIIDLSKYDINTLQVLHSSNNVRTDIKDNIVEFIFENINLAKKSGNPPVGGHGDVLFKIKTRPYLGNGDSVLNKANIYFDYNFPIITNDAITTFATLSNSIFKIDESVSVYPNPTSSKININANNNIKSIELYDVQGRILQTILNASGLDLSDKTKGIYFLKITTEKGSKIEKVVKE